MYYKFHVETLELFNGCPYHTIAKKAKNRAGAIIQIAQDAISHGLTIEEIAFQGQYLEMPRNCNSTFRHRLF